MFAGRERRFRKSLNIIQKRMRSPMPGQAKITRYFKPAGQSNPTSTKSAKSSTFTSCLSSAPRACFSANQDQRNSQIATDAISSLGSRLKPKALRTKSFRPSGQEYIVVANVDHTNKGIRVGTPLTNAKNNNSVKSSIKLFKSLKSFKKLKFSIFSSRLSSTSRFCFSVNQIAETSHVALDKISDFTSHQSFKFFIFVVSFNSLNSTLRFYLSINKTITSQELSSLQTTIHRCRRRFHMHLDIRVETTLKEKKR